MIPNALRSIIKELKSFSPDRNPFVWTGVNAICLLYSLFLAVIVWRSDANAKALRLANESYLIYDFVTTAVWCVEAAYEACAPAGKTSVLLILQLLLALYFLVVSGSLLYKWKWTDEDIDVIALEVYINIAAYLAAAMSTWRKHKSQLEQYEALVEDDGMADIS